MANEEGLPLPRRDHQSDGTDLARNGRVHAVRSSDESPELRDVPSQPYDKQEPPGEPAAAGFWKCFNPDVVTAYYIKVGGHRSMTSKDANQPRIKKVGDGSNLQRKTPV